jgi:hypothetical protein
LMWCGVGEGVTGAAAGAGVSGEATECAAS